MSNPTIAQEAVPLAVGATYLGFLAQLPPDAVLGMGPMCDQSQ